MLDNTGNKIDLNVMYSLRMWAERPYIYIYIYIIFLRRKKRENWTTNKRNMKYAKMEYNLNTNHTLNLSVIEKRYWALFSMPLCTFLHNLLNVLIEIASKMALQRNLTPTLVQLLQPNTECKHAAQYQPRKNPRQLQMP
jgi:hypothetical protein